MSKKKSTEKESTSNALKQAESMKAELVNFVANNILNNITLNQVVSLVQQVAIKDGTQIVDDADDAKLGEIEAALEANKKAAQEANKASEIENADG